MGAKYTTNQTFSGYNSSPPADDGSQVASNLITWAKHKTKLSDPIKTEATNIDNDLVAAFDYTPRRITTSDTVVAGDHERIVEIAPTATTSVVVTLPDASTLGTLFRTYIKNSSAHSQTIARATGGDTIDGTAADITIPSKAALLLQTNNNASSVADGFVIGGGFGFLVPPGSVMPYAGSTAPSGWLLCYGQAISRSTYAGLFNVISTTYGVGDGSTTFNVPDIRGRVVAGQDDMGGTSANRLTDQSGGLDGDTLGDTGGAETHTLVTGEMPAHTHTQRGSASDGSTADSNPSRANSANDENAGETASTGGDGAHNNVQPTIILNYIIRT